MKNLFVGNLPFGMSESEMSTQLRELFEGFGPVERVSVITDRDTGKPRGFAFVEMDDDDAAAKAIAGLNGREFEGRALSVSEARPKMDRGGGEGRGGGRSGGGFRGGSSNRPRGGPRW